VTMTGEPQKRSRSVKLIDVARRAGVDVSTVSRVIRGDDSQRVREDTRQRINEAVTALGYKANAMARGLRTARSQTLGLVLPRLDNPVFADMFEGVEAAARARGYSVLISHRFNEKSGNAFLHLTEANRVDGLLVISYDSDDKLLEGLASVRVPVVMLNRRGLKGIGYVAHDSHAAAYMATQHLLQLGHRHIGHLGGNLKGYNGSNRLKGYQAALADYGVAFDPSLVLEIGYDAEVAVEATRQLVRQASVKPTAIFAATLMTGAGAMRALHEDGYQLPDDMSIVTLSDGPLAKLLHPQMTTVVLESHQMGMDGTNLLIDTLEFGAAGQRPDGKTLQPSGLALRGSTKKLNN